MKLLNRATEFLMFIMLTLTTSANAGDAATNGGPKPKYLISIKAAFAIETGLTQAHANEGTATWGLSSACKVVGVEKRQVLILDEAVPGSSECMSLANPVNMAPLRGVYDPSAYFDTSDGIKVVSTNGVFDIVKPFWREEYGKPEKDIAREVVEACGKPIAPEEGSFAQYYKTPECLAVIDANAVALLPYLVWVDKGDSSSPVVTLNQDFPGGFLPMWFRGEGL